MRVEIWRDERWPDYGISPREPNEHANADIPDELYARFKAVSEAYEAVQDEIEALFLGRLGRLGRRNM